MVIGDSGERFMGVLHVDVYSHSLGKNGKEGRRGFLETELVNFSDAGKFLNNFEFCHGR